MSLDFVDAQASFAQQCAPLSLRPLYINTYRYYVKIEESRKSKRCVIKKRSFVDQNERIIFDHR